MVKTQNPELAHLAPGGKYWRHAPVVSFSETPCEAGKPLEGLGYSPVETDEMADAGIVKLAGQVSLSYA